jgi:hypothetical protein
LTHFPLEQSSVHAPIMGHVFAQSPDEQSTLHGAVMH